MSESVNYAVTDGVAHIRLNRPDAANALNLPAAQQLRAAAVRAGEDDEVRAVLVTGAGSRFCAGGDVRSFVEADDQAAYLRELATEADAATTAIAALEKPVVAAVHGAVAGAGLALMLSCDVVVAASGTKFVFAYPSIGLTPDCGLSYLLPRAIGQQRALTFALSGKPVDADRRWSGACVEVAENAETAAALSREVPQVRDGSVPGARSVLLLRAGGADRAATGAEEARTISDMVTGAEAGVDPRFRQLLTGGPAVAHLPARHALSASSPVTDSSRFRAGLRVWKPGIVSAHRLRFRRPCGRRVRSRWFVVDRHGSSVPPATVRRRSVR